jgi:ATP-dependent DNA helicase RecG
VPEYPLEAVREAVANALCHRDYAASGTVQIRVYDDRMEVWNPGMLPPELTVEALYQEHPSRPRNRRLALALYRARLIEQWGTGTIRIVQACEARGMPRPEFVSEMGMFIVRFRKPSPGVEAAARVGREERFRLTLAYVREHGKMTRARYRELFHVSDAQAGRDLKYLVDHGLLARQGHGPAAHYMSRGKT